MSSTAPGPSPVDGDRPNILLLFPDQLRWDFLGAYGATFGASPNLDRLAGESLVFERALSMHPVCIPARAALLTGCNAVSTGVLTNNHWLRPDHAACGMPSWPALLAAAGYRTAAAGKLHHIPWDSDEGFAWRASAEDKRHVHIEDDYHAYLAEHGLRKLRGWEEPGYTEYRMAGISPIPLAHQVDVWTGAQAVRFLDEDDGAGPWALMVGFPGPHDPYDPPAERAQRFAEARLPAPRAATPASERFRDAIIAAHRGGSSRVDLERVPAAVWRRVRAHYAALIEIIDGQVGEILAALDRRGLRDRTVVVFASDHGDFVGDYGFLGKNLFFEPAMHVPMLVRAPGGPRGVRSGELVTVTDLFATFLALAGLENRTGGDSHPLPGLGLGGERRQVALGAVGEGVCIDDGRHRLARYANGCSTLFDLASDPDECRNLVQDPAHADLCRQLDQALAEQLLRATLLAHGEKRYPYLTMTPDHPAHRRGWQRAYPHAGQAAPG